MKALWSKIFLIGCFALSATSCAEHKKSPEAGSLSELENDSVSGFSHRILNILQEMEDKNVFRGINPSITEARIKIRALNPDQAEMTKEKVFEKLNSLAEIVEELTKVESLPYAGRKELGAELKDLKKVRFQLDLEIESGKSD